MMTCTVVCPIYKSALSHEEEIAVKNNSNVLKNYRFVFLHPENLNLSYYNQFDSSNIEFVPIANKYFGSVKNYNTLLISEYFWSLFNTDFLLICQTDCWVFRDELKSWTMKEIDYIGSPWFEGFNNANEKSKIVGVGNGGFSLRSVRKTKLAMSEFKWSRFFWTSVASFNLKNIYYLLKALFSNKGLNEDKYFCLCLSYICDFKVANISDAIQFGFESNPDRLYLMNDMRLPFGCHGWNRYSPEFWKKHIPELESYFDSILA